MDKKYILNQETGKIELRFDKADYLALSQQEKSDLKTGFLWSGKEQAWVSRSTKNHYTALRVAKKLGFEDGGKVGERLSYAEELDRKAEKAEARAERYEEYSDNAEQKAKQLQADFNKYRKDIAWLTQPIIAGHSGSATFKRHRDKVVARYERGFEEYQKSEYYQERAKIARATADNAKLKNKVYLHNRIKESNKNIKKLQESIVKVEESIYKIQNGEVLKYYDGTIATIEGQESNLENYLDKYEYEQDKLEFFEKCLNDLGGVEFSRENIKPGYIVNMKRWGKCEIVSAGSVNVTFKILDGGATGHVLTEPYAAIVEILKEKPIEAIKNPYKINDVLCWYNASGTMIITAFQVLKVTEKSISIQEIEVKDGKPATNQFKAGSKPQRKGIVKSKYSDFVGAYHNDWQLQKYA